MPAPRLLDKKSINAELASNRKLEYEKGLELSKKVDAVRLVLEEEEQKLEQFRTESIRQVRLQINPLLKEKEVLEVQIEGLKRVKEKLEEEIISKL